MMDAFLAFAALLVLSWLISRFLGVNGSVAPLLAISLVALYLSVAGVLDLLLPAGWALYLLVFGAGGAMLWRTRRKQQSPEWGRLMQPGFLLFAGAGLVLLAYLWFRQPVFSEWDEFSLWGTAAKLLKLNNRLYTMTEMGWPWTATQSPALFVFGYFCQFMGKSFQPWKVFWAYDIIMLACFAAVMAPLQPRHRRLTVSYGVLLPAVPFVFTVFFRLVYLNTSYMTAYGDLISGVIFGGALAAYYALRRQNPRVILLSGLPLAFFALVKDNAFPIALVAAGIMAADYLLFCAPGLDKKIGVRLAGAAAFFGITAASYMAWRQHANWANAQNAVTGGESTSTPIGEAVAQTAKELFGLVARSARFDQALAAMRHSFSFEKVSMAGNGVATAALILGVFGFAIVLSGSETQRRRGVLAALLSFGGFWGYQFVLLVSYAHIYTHSIENGVPDYGRYLSSYYAGWLMLALVFLLQTAMENPSLETAKAVNWRRLVPAAWAGSFLMVLFLFQRWGKSPDENSWQRYYLVFASAVGLWVVLAAFLPQKSKAAGVISLGMAVCAAVCFLAWVPAGLSVLDYSDRQFIPQREAEARVESLLGHLEQPGRVFYVNQQGDGQQWFMYSYYMLPRILDYSITGGARINPPAAGKPSGDADVTLEQMKRHLEQQDCQYIWVEKVDDDFVEAYGSLFSDGLAGWSQDGGALYQRAEDGTYRLAGH